MGTHETKVRGRYIALCGELGDEITKRRLAQARIDAIEAEIDRLNVALLIAVEADAPSPPEVK